MRWPPLVGALSEEGGDGAKGNSRWPPLVGALSEEGGDGAKGSLRWPPLVSALSEEGGDGAKGTVRDGHPSSARHLRQGGDKDDIRVPLHYL